MRLAPVLAALLATTVTLAGCSGGGDGDEPEQGPLVWTFSKAFQPADRDVQVVALWNGSSDPPVGLGIDWLLQRGGRDALGFLTVNVAAGGSIENEGLNVTAYDGEGPFFGLDGYNATRTTVFLFNEDAELQGVIAEDSTAYSHLPWLAGEFFLSFDYVAYYLGDADEAPEGTTRLPAAADPFKQSIRDALHGLPEGAVASTVIDEEDYRDRFPTSIGDLYVTARIDALVHAP